MSYTDPPWLMGAGAQHSAETARSLPFLVTGPYNGIGSPTSFKVMAQGTPNGSVRVLPGVATIYDTHTANSYGSYVVREATEQTVNIAPTSSAGGRSDLVILKVRDPIQRSYVDAPNGVPNPGYQWWTLDVVSGVASNTTGTWTSGGAYAAIVLARIDIPANTGTITSAMITDLRMMASSRKDIDMYVRYPTVNTTLTVNSYMRWPDTEVLMLDVPTWATRMIAVTTMTGLHYTGNTRQDAVFRGKFGGSVHPEVTIATLNSNQRFTHVHSTSWYVAAERRGQKITYEIEAKQQAGTAGFQSEVYSTMLHQIYFMEVPD